MKRQVEIALLAAATMVTAGMSGGCSEKLEPGEDAVLYYIRGASVNGRVRRLWPAGQEYVNKVLEARARYVKHVTAMTEPLGVYSLWDDSDPRWNKKDELQKRERALSRLLSVEGADARTALDDLDKAARKIPADLALEGEAKEIFLEQLFAAMSYDGSDLGERLAATVQNLEAHRDLFAKALQCNAADTDADTDGDADRTACKLAIDEQREALRSEAVRARDAFLVEAKAEILAIAPNSAKAKKRSFEKIHLEDRMKYFRDRSKSFLQSARSLLEKTREEIESLSTAAQDSPSPSADKDGSASLASKEALVGTLEEDIVQLKDKVAAINAAYDAAKSDSPASE